MSISIYEELYERGLHNITHGMHTISDAAILAQERRLRKLTSDELINDYIDSRCEAIPEYSVFVQKEQEDLVARRKHIFEIHKVSGRIHAVFAAEVRIRGLTPLVEEPTFVDLLRRHRGGLISFNIKLCGSDHVYRYNHNLEKDFPVVLVDATTTARIHKRRLKPDFESPDFDPKTPGKYDTPEQAAIDIIFNERTVLAHIREEDIVFHN
jgi:hypothetical protein